MNIKQVEASYSMVRGTFIYDAESDWFVIDLKLGKSVSDIIYLFKEQTDLRDLLLEMNHMLTESGNPFKFRFSQPDTSYLKNQIETVGKYHSYSGDVITLEIQYEDSDSVMHKISRIDGDTTRSCESHISYLAMYFQQFASTINEFVIETMTI